MSFPETEEKRNSTHSLAVIVQASLGEQIGSMRTPPRVLVVDDYDDAREMYAEFLTFKGFDVAQARNGIAALALATSLLPEVLVLDLSLPDINGIEVTRTLKKTPATAGVPIIMLTAHAQSRMLEEAREAGCAAVLVKPCAPEDLLAVVTGLANVRTE